VSFELQTRDVTWDGLKARVHVAGRGPALVLLHGGWGGASMHWSTVWERFTRRGFRVILPELPSVGAADQPGLGSVRACAGWLDGLLCALDVQQAHLVGNSLGAAIAWACALDFHARCGSLVLVNGGPYRALPAVVQAVARRWPVRWVVRELLRRAAYRPRSLNLAFADPARVPEDVRHVVDNPAPPQLDDIVPLFLSGLPFAPPRAKVLWLWGEEDRLPGRQLSAAQAWQAKVPGSTLRTIPKAGHLPQIEQPELFVDAVCSFVTSSVASLERPDASTATPAPASAG
jgi:2-hydroxy-6-oxonona-2,4-dienedioate hydrolase